MVQGSMGLVLEGGGMRGIYTAGVLDVFMEEELTFDGVIGVSAGAIHGATFVAGQVGRNIRYYKKYCNDPRFMSYRSFLKTGDLVGEKFGYHELPDVLDPFDYEAFKNSGIPFYVTVTNVLTGLPEYRQITDMKKQIDLLRASATLPYVSKIVNYKGKKYLDGGCSDSIPVRAFQTMGFTWNIIVRTQHDNYRKKEGKFHPEWLAYRDYPRFAQTLANRPQMYNREVDWIRDAERLGDVFVIAPSIPLSIGRMEHDAEKLQEVYEIGRKDAANRLGALRRWMEERKKIYGLPDNRSSI